MAILSIPEEQKEIKDPQAIKAFLNDLGVLFENWNLKPQTHTLGNDAILDAYSAEIERLMKKNNYKTADVINVQPDTPNLLEIRNKFLKEHTHSEDEVRFFARGKGLFWFHIDDLIFSVLCQPGDLIGVPANTPHWFDLGDSADVLAIRIFTNPEGWVANYTNSGIDQSYNPSYS